MIFFYRDWWLWTYIRIGVVLTVLRQIQIERKMMRRKRYLTNDIFDGGRIEAGRFESSLIGENQDTQPPRQRLRRRLINLSHIDTFEAEENPDQDQGPEIHKTTTLRHRGQKVYDFMGSSTTSTPKSQNFSHLVSPSIRPLRSDPDLIAEIEEEDHSTNSNGIVHLILFLYFTKIS